MSCFFYDVSTKSARTRFCRLAFVNGQLQAAGFCDPEDSNAHDLSLWLPTYNDQLKLNSAVKPTDAPSLDLDTCKYIMNHIGGQFCDLVHEEKEALSKVDKPGKLPNAFVCARDDERCLFVLAPKRYWTALLHEQAACPPDKKERKEVNVLLVALCSCGLDKTDCGREVAGRVWTLLTVSSANKTLCGSCGLPAPAQQIHPGVLAMRSLPFQSLCCLSSAFDVVERTARLPNHHFLRLEATATLRRSPFVPPSNV